MSLPLRERGLKHGYILDHGKEEHVAPPAGAWIETCFIHNLLQYYNVAPPAGAWIETFLFKEASQQF